MGFKRYVLKRILQLVPTVFLIVIINWLLIRSSPVDPALALAGQLAPPETIEALRIAYGLNKPIHEQLMIYLAKVFQGDLGISYTYGIPVLSLILERLPATLLLTIPAQVLSFIIGILFGTYLGSKFPSKRDTLGSMFALFCYSVPSFLAGLWLILVFGLNLRWFPIGGMVTVTLKREGLNYLLDVLHRSVLPIITMSLWCMPVYLRVARASIIEALREDFIKTARALGLRARSVLFKHALRNALLPSVTLFGLGLGRVLTAAMITEIVFFWPGLGRLLIESILHRDYPLLSGIFIFSATLMVFVTILIDIFCAYLDPRVKLG